MYLVSLETLVLEELLYGEPINIKTILGSINVRTGEDFSTHNIYIIVRRLVAKGLIRKSRKEGEAFCELTPEGVVQAEKNRKIIGRIFGPASEPDSKE